VERIEIIRGPGATLWGANAVNGVINIITRSAADTQGGLVSGAAGNEERAIVAGRYGGRIGEHGHYRLYAKSSERGALALPDGSDPGDPNRLRQGGFRADWKDPGSQDAWTLQGDLYDGVIGELTLQDDRVDGANLLSRWTRTLAGGSDLTVQAYYDRTHRRIPAWFEEHRDTWDLELQHHLQVGQRHNVVWGAGYRTTRDDVVNSLGVGFFPTSRSVDLANVFAQDELSFLKDRLRLTLGSKVEHHESTGFEVQPSVRLAWAPDDDQTVWGAISRAVRSPTRLDEDIAFFAGDGQTVTVRGDRAFDSEKLTAYELGWRSRLRPDFFVDIATYYHDYDDLRSQERSAGGGLPIVLANKLEGQTYGAEIRTNYDLNPSWRLQGAYAYLGKRLRLDPDSTDPTGGQGEGNDPRHRFLLRSTFDLPHRTELDVWLRHVAELPAPRVPSYTEADLRLGWRATETLELSLVGRNLLHDQHPEAGPAAAREEVERSVYGKVLWRF
ncbi:MAG TPA: TonB-dependent receptor, partial [Thermoanaerobaculia bacterium]|nr:TonB-dependent receptor [Thermoanaerobaculia bacterium]